MRALLDTCTISELRKISINKRLKDVMDSLDEKDVYMSVISFGELTKGIFLLEDGQRRRDLLSWIGGLDKIFADRILGVDQETAQIWGEITAQAQKVGKIIPACDGLIAAIALRHGLHVVTRNSADFAPTGVLIINPWATD